MEASEMFEVESPAEGSFVKDSEGRVFRCSSPCYMPVELHLNTGVIIDPSDIPPAANWVYALHDPRDDPRYDVREGTGIAYIGVSNYPLRRYAEHMSGAWFAGIGLARKARKRRTRLLEPRDVWILELIGLGLSPALWLRASADNDAERKNVEGEWKKKYRAQGWCLLNIEGKWIAERTDYPNAPHPSGPMPEDVKKKIGDSLRGTKRGPLPAWHRALLREVNTGRKPSDETRERQSQSQIERWAREESAPQRQAASERMRKRNLSSAHLEKIREANQRPEVKKKRSASMKAVWAAKTSAERSEIARKREAAKTPEQRKAAVAKRAETARVKRDQKLAAQGPPDPKMLPTQRGKYSMHVRWHVKRGIVQEDCQFCIEGG